MGEHNYAAALQMAANEAAGFYIKLALITFVMLVCGLNSAFASTHQFIWEICGCVLVVVVCVLYIEKTMTIHHHYLYSDHREKQQQQQQQQELSSSHHHRHHRHHSSESVYY